MKRNNPKRAFNDSNPGRIRREERRATIRRKLGALIDGIDTRAL